MAILASFHDIFFFKICLVDDDAMSMWVLYWRIYVAQYLFRFFSVRAAACVCDALWGYDFEESDLQSLYNHKHFDILIFTHTIITSRSARSPILPAPLDSSVPTFLPYIQGFCYLDIFVPPMLFIFYAMVYEIQWVHSRVEGNQNLVLMSAAWSIATVAKLRKSAWWRFAKPPGNCPVGNGGSIRIIIIHLLPATTTRQLHPFASCLAWKTDDFWRRSRLRRVNNSNKLELSSNSIKRITMVFKSTTELITYAINSHSHPF